LERCSLLHVEDEDASAYLLRAALDAAGIGVSVYRVSDGEQALAFLNKSGVYQKARQPDLVVLDLNMPRVDGWTVLAKIRRREELRDVPIVVLSTSRQREDRERSLALGARRYIIKPHDFESLVEAAASICAEFLPQAVT